MPAGSSHNQADASLKVLVAVFHQLACGIRLEILCLLSEGPLCVSSIAEELSLGVTVVSGHLTHLAEHRLVERSTAGRRRIYGLSDQIQVRRTKAATQFILKPAEGIECGLVFPDSVFMRLRGPGLLSVEVPLNVGNNVPKANARVAHPKDDVTAI